MKYWGGIALALVAAPVAAKQDYASYEGKDAIQEGHGGTKVAKNGIDFWTSGSPPRRFQVLGILTDARKDRLLDGNVIGSKSVAKKTLEAGGNAVIVAGSDTAAAGFVQFNNAYANGNGFSGNSTGRMVNRTTTRLIVIKYLD
jgi:hypothetical protein